MTQVIFQFSKNDNDLHCVSKILDPVRYCRSMSL